MAGQPQHPTDRIRCSSSEWASCVLLAKGQVRVWVARRACGRLIQGRLDEGV